MSGSSKFFELDSPHPRRVVRQEHGDVLELTAEGWRYAPWLAPCVEGAAAETDLVELHSGVDSGSTAAISMSRRFQPGTLGTPRTQP